MSFGRPQLLVALCAVTAAAAVALGGARVAAENQAERVFREAREYTVRIRTQIETPFIADSKGAFQGAGFLIDARRGWILTNAHVVGYSPSDVQVAFADEDFQNAEKVYVDPFADVAVLRIADAGTRRPATLESRIVDVGEPVGVFGHPMGMYFTGTRGIISGHHDQFGPEYLQVDATVDHGNSGGPAISMQTGRVIGLATAGMDGKKGDRVNFVTPIDQVRPMLEQLRNGVIPSPPLLRVALLQDESEAHTLTVARSYDPVAWPLEPGDRIVSAAGAREDLETLTDLVTCLRGRTGPVDLTVERRGARVGVTIHPEPYPLVTHARGIKLDGALIASMTFEDPEAVGPRPRLQVHSVESGSAAHAMGLAPMDFVHTIDGKSFADLESLSDYLQQDRKGRPVEIVVTRMSGFVDRWLDYHVRELPGEAIAPVGAAKAQPVASNTD
jgi:serine protease Do